MKSSPHRPNRPPAPQRRQSIQSRRPCPRHKSVYCRLASVVLALSSGAAMSQAPDTDELALEQMSVRELMRLDTELALSQAKRKLQEALKAPGFAVSEVSKHDAAPRLIAIYGVGSKLAAEVRVGADSHLYMRGHPLPLGQRTPGKAVFALRDMDSTCVRLARGSQELQLCLAGQPAYGG